MIIRTDDMEDAAAQNYDLNGHETALLVQKV
jgi:hypothetical protein